MAEDNGFLSRWSRRKAQVKQGAPVAPEAPVQEPTQAPTLAPTLAPTATQADPVRPEVSKAERLAATPPPPTLDDVAALTKESDFSRFVAPDVDPGVKNAAMKKLFASDPHFNVMDGLDVYIDDYNKFEPIPKSMLRQLVNARALGLLDDELEEQPKPDNPDLDENADLQLQPDDAAGQPGAEQGPPGDVSDGADPDSPAYDAVPPRSA
jgi:Protein of unknown function (DUF3306)